MITIGKIGRIIRGSEKGWYVKVEPDMSEAKGFYIFYCKNHNFVGGLDEGFDDWVDSFESLIEYFKDENLEIVWEDGT
ncbi:MAG: hypothetical protein LUM44_22460 [Pyrinomonadaceae bacterium]|nr:hypothetical protein [Pyrinomonadaceae bacterium]